MSITDLSGLATGGQWRMGWAQRWRRHGWQNKSGAVAHVDLWTQILHLVEKLGEAIKWLHVPSHIGIKGNGRADHLADVGRRHSPLLFGHISIRPPPMPEDEELDHEQEESIWGWEEEYVSQPASAPSEDMDAATPTGSQQGTPAKPRSPPPTPLGDIEICTPIQVSKRPRSQIPGSTIS